MAEKMLTPEERAAETPVVQSAMQNYEQHYGLKLTERETSRVVERALDRLKSSATASEVKWEVVKQMFALLSKKDPARAAEFKKGAGKEKAEKPAEKKEKK